MGAPSNTQQEAREFRAEALSLWRITFGPVIWAVHFVASYGAVAVVCAKGDAQMLAALRIGLGLATLAALIAIAWLGWRAWRQWGVLRHRIWETDAGSDAHRHQFLGHAAFLLSVISFIGVAYVSIPLMVIGSCQ